MSIYKESEIAQAARSWAALDRLLGDPTAWSHLRRQFDRELAHCAQELIEDADAEPRLILTRWITEAHLALPSLAALATRLFHRLPNGQCDTAPPIPLRCPRGPRVGDRCVWTALVDPHRPPWFVSVFDECHADTGTRFCVVSQVCVRGAWDLADVLATERSARYALVDWAAPLLRLDHSVFGERPWNERAWLTRRLGAEDPLARLTARAHLAALDDDWRDLFASPSVLEYRRLWSLQCDPPSSGTRH